jgi:hypothetical protein
MGKLAQLARECRDMIAALPYADHVAGRRMCQSPAGCGDRPQELNDGDGLAALPGSTLLSRAGSIAPGGQLRLRRQAGG